MSLPQFPTDVRLTREDVINQIISSIAMEELGLSHIFNAEGEKIQYVLGTLPGQISPDATIDEVLKVNDSVRNTLDSAVQNQLLLNSKLSTALSACTMKGDPGPAGPAGPAGASMLTVFNPADAPTYLAGQLVYYGGTAYIVNVNNPAGTPGTSPDYTSLQGIQGPAGPAGAAGPIGPIGPAGAAGASMLTPFSAASAPTYLAGQLVSYNGIAYVVNVNSPTGTPGASPDYTPLVSPTPAGSIVAMSSPIIGTINYTVAGLAGSVMFVGPGASSTSPTIFGTPLNLLGSDLNVALTVPRAGTITNIAADFEITASVSAATGNNHVQAQLYRAAAGSNTFNPIASTVITLQPGVPIASVNVHTSGSVAVTVPVSAGDQLLMVFSGYNDGLISLAGDITGYARASLAIS